MKKQRQFLCKWALLLAFVGVALVACHSDEASGPCDVYNPLKKLGWLHKIKQQAGERTSSIIWYRYQEEDVFLIADCDNCPDGMAVVYNCEGETICEFGGIAGLNTCPDFFDTAAKQKTLWEQ